MCQRPCCRQQGSPPGLSLTPPCPTPSLLSQSVSSAERQGRASTAPPASSICPSLRDRARSCSKGASPLGAHPGTKGFLPGTARSAPHLPVPKDRSFAAAWVSCAGGEAADPAGICSGWLRTAKSFGKGMEPLNLGQTSGRDPHTAHRDHLSPPKQGVGVCAIWETPSPP